MLYYLATILSSSIFATFADYFKRKNIFLTRCMFFSSAVTMLLPLALRGMGVDYANYVAWYNYIASIPTNRIFVAYKFTPEPLYYLLNFYVAKVLGSYQWINVLCAFITIFFTFKGVFYFKEKIQLGITIWSVGFLYYYLMYGLNRMMIAVALITWSYQYFIEKKNWRLATCIFFASLFHYSALIMIPLYILMAINRDKKGLSVRLKSLVSVFFLFVIFYTITPKLLGGFSWFVRYYGYFQLNADITALNNNICCYLLIVLICLHKGKIEKCLGETNSVLLHFMEISIMLALVSMIIPIHRICYFFFPAVAILYGNVPLSLSVNLKNKHLSINVLFFYLIIFIQGVVWIYYVYEVSPLWGPFLKPYVFGYF